MDTLGTEQTERVRAAAIRTAPAAPVALAPNRADARHRKTTDATTGEATTVAMTSEATTRVLAALAPERGRFLAFARGRVGSDAEDVVQVALLRAALKAQTLKDPERVVPWFFQFLRHAIADNR